MAFLNGQMFISTDGPCGGALVQFDPATAASTVLGGDGLGCVYGLAVSQGTMFIVNCDGTVGTFDPDTGVVRLLTTDGSHGVRRRRAALSRRRQLRIPTPPSQTDSHVGESARTAVRGRIPGRTRPTTQILARRISGRGVPRWHRACEGPLPMKSRLDRFSVLLALAPVGMLLASADMVTGCSFPTTTPLTPEGQCQTAFDCSSGGEPCKEFVCEQHQCVEQDSPAGTVPSTTSDGVPACHSVICDGHGAESVVVDPSATPPQDSVAPCQKAACDANGNVVTAPDPSNLPPDTPGDCKKSTCDANGNVTFTPDPSDVPQDTMPGDCKTSTCDANGNVTYTPDPSDVPADTPGDCKTTSCDAGGNVVYTPNPADTPPPTMSGDCMQGACDAAGNVISVPANDPPPAGACSSYTCQNGAAVAAPANVGMVCSPEGFVCSPTGTCDVCPTADATCTDPGPGAAAHSLATAHGFGTIGYCDTDGYGTCDTLQPGVTTYFGYKSDGSLSFCSFDPYVGIQASASVTLCEYFECPSVTCPSGSTAATMGSLPGCCITGAATEMAITPSCEDSEVFITVETQNPTCTSYSMGFHS